MENREFVTQQDNTRVNNYQTNRPETSKRLFVSQEVERQIDHIKQLLTNAKLAWMFENCFPNTLDTTVHFDGKEDTFVYTGDIHAMWLRDSGAQVWPYVQLANKDCLAFAAGGTSNAKIPVSSFCSSISTWTTSARKPVWRALSSYRKR